MILSESGLPVLNQAELDIEYVEVNGGKFPSKAYDDDAGWDLVANSDVNGKWAPQEPDCSCHIKKLDAKHHCMLHNTYLTTAPVGGTCKVMLGFQMAMPPGWFADIRPRSGLATKVRVLPANTPGTIDAGYRDELSVVLMNLGREPFDVFRGDKVAQMLFLPVPTVRARRVDSLRESARGKSGYGSTGIVSNC